MFGSKKIEELTIELNEAKKDYAELLDKLQACDYLRENGLEAIMTFDYKGIVSFGGNNIKVLTTIKSDSKGLCYCIDLYKNENLVKGFVVHRIADDELISPLTNKIRVINYGLTRDITQYVVKQVSLYVEKMGSDCKIESIDKIPENFKKLFQLVD